MDINNIAKDDFLNYAMAVIKNRAIPNVEDNLKPVHRRILYTMYENKLISKARYVKSARTTGNVMGQYHPHGDTAIYDALVRLSQTWKMRYPLIDVQGNNGSISGASAAAQRYTEAKLSPIGDLMVEELKYQPVDYIETYDGEGREPSLLPSLFPNVLCNGNMGIAVGMSSSILPHNLREVAAALVAYIDNPSMTVDELIGFMPGPDLPTGGTINNIEKIKEIYSTGSGTLEVQAKYHIEEKGNKTHIVVTEIPYLMNIEDNITTKIKKLAEEGLDDIYNIENNSGHNGLEYRIILKPKANTGKILQILFDQTGLKNNIRVGLTVLKNKKPIQANMLDLLENYIRHRHNIITSIMQSKKDKADARLHIVEGLLIALQDIDGVIKIVKESKNKADARSLLMNKYSLSEKQANAILDMRISQINKMDADKLIKEKEELVENIKYYRKIIENKSERDKIIKEQLNDIKKRFGDSRRTILKSTTSVNTDIKEEFFIAGLFKDNVISIKNKKDLAFSAKGRVGTKLFKDGPKQLINISNKELLLLLDSEGKSYLAKEYSVDEEDTVAENIDKRVSDEIVFMTRFGKEEISKEYFVTVSKKGVIKKTSLKEYNNFKSPIKAVKLRKDDSILYAGFHNDDEFVFVTSKEKYVKFSLKDVKDTGRNTIGVKSMEADYIVDVQIAKDDEIILSYNIEGKGKITNASEFSVSTRASKGQKIPEELSYMIKVKNPDITVLSNTGQFIRFSKNDLTIKSPKASGSKIYGKQVSKICN